LPNAAQEPVVLAEGIDAYIALFRTAQAPAGGPPTLAGMRLAGDIAARAFQRPYPEGMHVFTTFAVGEAHELALRIYHPGRDQLRPALCYYHGGGFSMGSLESFDGLAAALSAASGAVVISVHYRRIPESSCRQAQEDCYAALLWLAEHAAALGVDPRRLGVAGDSAGAMLATTTAMMARDRGGPALCCQGLFYGVFSLDPARPYYEVGRDPVLTRDKVESYIALYRQTDAADPAAYGAPVDAADLTGLPPAVMVGAEHDLLLDEDRDYADRLRAAGVEADLHVAPGMIHGFLRAVVVSSAAQAEMDRIGLALRRRLQPA
jgi:acetyl esterase